MTDLCPLNLKSLLLKNENNNNIIKSFEITSKELPKVFENEKLFAVPILDSENEQLNRKIYQFFYNFLALEELLGKEFLQFLDPGFNTTKYELFEKVNDDGISSTNTK